MTALQAVMLVLVAVFGAVVVAVRTPLRQVAALSSFGSVLTVVFFLLQAPDVALAQLAVGAVLIPLTVLLAIAKTRRGP